MPAPHPQNAAKVRELELNMDLKSVGNLLEFLEKVFNGGSGACTGAWAGLAREGEGPRDGRGWL